MKAAYLAAKRKFDIRDVPEPRIENDSDLLVKLRSSGSCGSDIHNYRQGRTESLEVTFPMIIGHECSAIFEEVGKAVKKVKAGDRMEIASRLGATHSVHPNETDVVREILDATRFTEILGK